MILLEMRAWEQMLFQEIHFLPWNTNKQQNDLQDTYGIHYKQSAAFENSMPFPNPGVLTPSLLMRVSNVYD
mgnify:CR=1 FL=1